MSHNRNMFQPCCGFCHLKKAFPGSRERQKWVMEYHSYMFKPSRWTLEGLYFVKIDTWLDGLCEPQHVELWSKAGALKRPQWRGGSQKLRRPARSLANAIAAEEEEQDVSDEEAEGAGERSSFSNIVLQRDS
jgi:hypothetical protein